MSPFSKELLRKSVHLSELFIIAGYTLLHFTFSPRTGVLALTGFLLLLLAIEFIRVDYKTPISHQINDTFFRLLNLRKHERDNVTGAIFLIISTTIVFAAFDYPIALLALLYATVGDLAAAIMGMAFGTVKIFRNKSYVGTLSGLTVNIIVGYLILPDYPEIFLPMALAASTVEMLTQKLDDNLTVPLFSGFIGQLIVSLGGFILPALF